MAFKTKEEMFGDGGGFGAAVPYSTSAPAGHGAGNRGVAFGEPLTSAIANRPHYALALNDEDLNTRLAAFEVGGIDAAYDNGTVGPAGGGREVTKDAGAVETRSAHAAVSGDTQKDVAHFRANALGDLAGSSVGFDAVGKRTAANGQSGNDPVAGFLDRRPFAKAAGLTQLTYEVSATLNPGGASATRVRVAAGQFHSAGNTDLAKGYDLVEIKGASSFNGLYIFSSLGAATTDAELERLDGTAPSFTADTAVTITVYRVRLGSLGSYSSRGRLFANTMMGFPEDTSVLDLVPGRKDSSTTNSGSDRALRVMRRSALGNTFEAAAFDFLGRLNFSLDRSALLTDTDENYRGGNYATWKAHQEDGGVGHIVQNNDVAVLERWDFVSTHMLEMAGLTPALTPNSTLMEFNANSPVTGEVLFDVAQDATLPNYLFGIGMMVEIVGSAGADGLYYATEHIISGNQGFLLRKLDGTVPTHFPITGTFTGNVLITQVLGRHVEFPNAVPLNGAGAANVTAYNVLSLGAEQDACALTVFGPRNQALGDDRHFVRFFSAQPASGDNFAERFAVDVQGRVRSAETIFSGNDVEATDDVVAGGSMRISSVSASDDFKFDTPRARVVEISMHRGHSPHGTGTDPSWRFSNNEGWKSFIANAPLYFPLDNIPSGCVITQIELIVSPFGTGGNAPVALFQESVPDYVTPGVPTFTTLETQAISGSSGVYDNFIVTVSPNITVDRSTRSYFLRINSSLTAGATDNDFVVAIRISYTDPGPRNG